MAYSYSSRCIFCHSYQLTSLISIQNNELLLDNNQLLLIKIAISANASGIIFGAIYLYIDVMTERDLAYKLRIQRLYLLLKGENRYENVISSSPFRLFRILKLLSLLSFLVAIGSWVVFIWAI